MIFLNTYEMHNILLDVQKHTNILFYFIFLHSFSFQLGRKTANPNSTLLKIGSSH